jgi:hypothetical protein
MKFHLSMLIVDSLNSGPIRSPGQLRGLAREGKAVTDEQMLGLFEKLKIWASSYLKAENVILERAAKSQRFSDYLLKMAAEDRKRS